MRIVRPEDAEIWNLFLKEKHRKWTAADLLSKLLELVNWRHWDLWSYLSLLLGIIQLQGHHYLHVLHFRVAPHPKSPIHPSLFNLPQPFLLRYYANNQNILTPPLKFVALWSHLWPIYPLPVFSSTKFGPFAQHARNRDFYSWIVCSNSHLVIGWNLIFGEWTFSEN